MTTDIKQRLEALEARASNLDEELNALRQEIALLWSQVDDTERVWAIEFGGKTWFTDGYRCIRDSWPGEYALKGDPCPDLTPLLASCEAITRPVVMVATVLQGEDCRLAVLSNGAFVLFDWMTELQAMRGCTMAHGADPKQPVVFRDAEGEVVAVQMPVDADAPLVLTEWRGLDGSPLAQPPACVKLPTPIPEAP